jgi:DNA-binding PadR family transcriptional regulator
MDPKHPNTARPDPFGSGFIDGLGTTDRPFGLARKLRATDLRLMLLRLLADKPAHGYELIKALEESSRGYYVPSPGMIYPALAHLERAGFAASEPEGQRKRYRLTDAGADHLGEQHEAAEALAARFRRVGERMQHLRRALGTADAAAQDPLGWSIPPGLSDAWWELRVAVGWPEQSTPQETARIAAILREACARIQGRQPG